MDLLTYIDNEISKTNGKTKDYDRLAKQMIKDNINVSQLKDIILEQQKYHRIFFQVSLGQIDNYREQFLFIENNSDKLMDWWHVDNLLQFIKKNDDFNYAYKLSKK